MKDRRAVAVAAGITGAAIPGFILIFVLWGRLGLPQADAADPEKVAAFATLHPVAYAALPVAGVVMHVAALVLVLGLHRRLAQRAPLLAACASACGLAWVFGDILQNLMHYYAFLATLPPGAAVVTARAAEALWHAGHFAGGLWVLSLAASGFGRAYRGLSAVAGSVFALHSFVFPLVPAWFGLEMLLVPVWAFATAFVVSRAEGAESPASGPSDPLASTA